MSLSFDSIILIAQRKCKHRMCWFQTIDREKQGPLRTKHTATCALFSKSRPSSTIYNGVKEKGQHSGTIARIIPPWDEAFQYIIQTNEYQKAEITQRNSVLTLTQRSFPPWIYNGLATLDVLYSVMRMHSPGLGLLTVALFSLDWEEGSVVKLPVAKALGLCLPPSTHMKS